MLKKLRSELAEIGEMKGRYERDVEDMQWASQIIPFLRYPEKVNDPGYKLIAAIVNCVDWWREAHGKLALPGIEWRDIVDYVQSRSDQSASSRR